jgi:hypothetical protein
LTRKPLFGFENRDWKHFTLFDGAKVLVPGQFNVMVDTNSDCLLYPEGDLTVPPSGRMPKGAHFFDSIIRHCRHASALPHRISRPHRAFLRFFFVAGSER